jgi:FolB domain-containing protein
MRIVLSGIRASGRHGANPGERLQAQDFVVDLDVIVERDDDDDLNATIDYRVIAQTARDCVAGTSFVLVESLAEAVAREVFGQDRVTQAIATVHKPAAAASLGVDDVAVEAIVVA